MNTLIRWKKLYFYRPIWASISWICWMMGGMIADASIKGGPSLFVTRVMSYGDWRPMKWKFAPKKSFSKTLRWGGFCGFLGSFIVLIPMIFLTPDHLPIANFIVSGIFLMPFLFGCLCCWKSTW